MKNILFFTLLCLTISLSGQTRQDTAYQESGQIANIKHFSKIDTRTVSKSYLFQRGLNFGDEVWQLDSISVFDAMGAFLNTRSTSTLDPAPTNISNPNQRTHPAPEMKEEAIHLFREARIAGYANSQVFTTLSLSVKSQKSTQLKIVNGPNNIKLFGASRPVSQKRHEVTLSVNLPPGYRQQTLRIEGPEGKMHDVRLSLRGHDLTEADFIPNNTDVPLKQVDAQERENIYLRLESTEKLLSIYRSDKVLYRLPVGRQVDVIPVYHLPAGDYRMEIIDLSTGEKRSYGLKR
ncbi:MAG: hypothetical protein AB8H12_21105 [Lewinella sp.]